MAPTYPWQIVVGFLIDVNSENRQLKAENRRLEAQLAEASENSGRLKSDREGSSPGRTLSTFAGPRRKWKRTSFAS